jgi:gentisate 1,2-dioxygenase
MTEKSTSDTTRFADVSDRTPPGPRAWRPLKITAAEIETEIERLAARPAPEGGRRASLIVHPESTEPGLGLAPGVDVTIEVLKPGERTVPVRQNASQVQLCLRGEGVVHVADRDIPLARWDVCNIPSMKGYSFRNNGNDLWVRLSYSNAPLLSKLGVHYVEPISPRPATPESPAPQADRFVRETAPDFVIGDSGARLRGYEYLVDIEVVDSDPHHWPWEEVSRHLSQEFGDGKRTIMALYNPATERRTGTTHSFFVTAANIPPGTPPLPRGRGHRHTSVAINYHFRGSGRSVVDGQEIEWQAGDLLLSAPGWREHGHYHGPDGLGIFTVQDHPLQIGMESLVWQEKIGGPILALGSEAGQTGYVGPREVGQPG